MHLLNYFLPFLSAVKDNLRCFSELEKNYHLNDCFRQSNSSFSETLDQQVETMVKEKLTGNKFQNYTSICM